MIPTPQVTITAENFRAALQRAVDAKGADYIYQKVESIEGSGNWGCAYIDPQTGEASCLIGCALVDLGVSKEWLKLVDADTDAAGLPTSMADGVLKALGAYADIANAARAAQVEQDSGDTWGRALGTFDAEMARSKA